MNATNTNGTRSNPQRPKRELASSKPYTGRLRRFGLCAVATAMLLASCNHKSPFGAVEFTAYPPDLKRIPIERIRSSMWVLAAEVNRLDDLLREERESGNARRLEIEHVLTKMEVAARAIDEPGRTSQHPMLNRFLGRFIERLEHAQRDVRRNPPNYYMAGTVAGACFVCHSSTQTASSKMP